MKKREKTIAMVMAGMVVLWVIMNLSQAKQSVRSSSTIGIPVKPQAEETPAEQTEDVGIDLIALRVKLTEVPEAETEPVDPFMKLDARQLLRNAPMELSDLQLAGIIFEGEQPMALINGEILKEGDIISGFELSEIRRNEVVLSKGLEIHILKLFIEVEE